MAETKLVASDWAANNNFGYSIAISNQTIVVSAIYDANWSGSAYVFGWNGSAWSQTAKFIASDEATNDQFGWSS